MDNWTRDQLIENGFDVNRTMERFMNNETLYFKFLKKFIQDESFAKLSEAIKAKDCKQAFMYAHTLKGVSANLGIEVIHQAVIPMVEKLRNDDMSAADKDMEKLQVNYDNACKVITKICECLY